MKRVDLTQPMRGAGPAAAAAGTAIAVCGIITLATPVWAGPTHMSPAGSNWVNVLLVPLTASGLGLVLAGIVLLLVALGQPREGAKEQIKARSPRATSLSHHWLRGVLYNALWSKSMRPLQYSFPTIYLVP